MSLDISSKHSCKPYKNKAVAKRKYVKSTNSYNNESSRLNMYICLSQMILFLLPRYTFKKIEIDPHKHAIEKMMF